MFENLDIYSILLILFAISLGGFTKGVISFGLPLVSLPILSFVLNPKQAIFLLFFTVIAVNLKEIKFKNFESYKKVYFSLSRCFHRNYYWKYFVS